MKELLIMQHGEPESIRIFADDKTRKPKFVGHRTVPYGSIEYTDLVREAQEYHAGVFFSVNRTDGVGASAANITEVRTYYVDLDKVNKREAAQTLIKSAASPSAIVETKNGLHAYWYSMDETVNREQYDQVQRGLIHAFKGDPSAKDIARVLRVPNTLHLKDPSSPHLIRVIYQKPIGYYPEQLLELCPPPTARVYAPPPPPTSNKGWGRVLNQLMEWEPETGERNGALLITAGIAIYYGIRREQFVQEMLPIAQTWDIPRNVQDELDRVSKWAYNTGKAIHPTALRKYGIG